MLPNKLKDMIYHLVTPMDELKIGRRGSGPAYINEKNIIYAVQLDTERTMLHFYLVTACIARALK